MGLMPNYQKKTTNNFVLKTCPRCNGSYGKESYAPVQSWFFPDGTFPICDMCIDKLLEESDYSWEVIDNLCQTADIPFVPKEVTRLQEITDGHFFHKYAEVFLDSQYERLGWGEYHKAFLELKTNGLIEDQLPLLADRKRELLSQKWGKNYDDEALDYLENLYAGILTSQQVNGALQGDQALKLCKISYEIDSRLREGSDIDKLLTSYDKLVKSANFTPQNAKNINDFDSVGELIKWLEKRGWINSYYDDITKDIVDETIKNIEAFNRRLYTNESGIGDEITQRIQLLRETEKLTQEESYYGTDEQFDLDNYENDGYEMLVMRDFDNNFEVDLDG